MKYSMSLVSALAAVAVAQPHHHHNIRHVSNIEALKAVQARNEAAGQSTATSWVTHWVTVTEFVEGDVAAPATTVADVPSVPVSSVVVTPTLSVEEPATTEEATSQEPTPEEATPTPTPSPEPETTVEESVVVPTPTPSVPAIADAAKPKPSTTSTSTSTTEVEPTPSTTEAAPSPSTTEAAPKPSSAPSAPSSGTRGEVTFYDIGLGACGEDHSGQDMTTNVVALSADLIGPLSNGNPYCGRSITVKANGKTTTALVVDKCMGCASSAIDLSKAAFLELWGDLGVGRGDCEWWFNN